MKVHFVFRFQYTSDSSIGLYVIYRLKTVLRNVSREHLHGKNIDTENHRTRAFLFTRHLARVLLCDVRYTQSNVHVNCREHFPCIFTTEILLTWIHAYTYTQILYIFLIMYDSYNSKLYEANYVSNSTVV